MPENRSRFVLLCQQLLALAVVIAIAAPAANLVTLDIVAPRPHAGHSMARDKYFWEVDARYWHRPACKPGITGLAQVRGVPLLAVPIGSATLSVVTVPLRA